MPSETSSLNASRDSEGNIDYSQRSDRISAYIDVTNRIEELAAETANLTVETGCRAQQIFHQLNEIPLRRDADVQEMLLCAKTCVAVPNFFIEKIPTLKISGDELTLESYKNRLKELIRDNGFEETMLAFDFLRASVSFQTLNARRQERTVELNPEKKKRQRRAKEEIGPATQPQEVVANSGTDDHNFLTDLVLKTLVREWGYNKKQPVDFWRFVIDPNSFINTVENMFSVNILVNNGQAQLIFDNNKEMSLAPVMQPLNQQKPACSKCQEITAINMKIFEEKISLYQLREAVIKRPETEEEEDEVID